MRYALSYEDPASRYLRELPATREGRLGLNGAIQALAAIPDALRLDPAVRLGQNRFQFGYFFKDGPTNRHLTLIVDDSGASYGVLHVAWADCTP